MKADALDTLRAALSDGESLVLVVVPPGRLRDLVPATPPDTGFARDLSVAEYRATHEPDLSLGRIRELCAAGAFPDATDARGEVTPGAYKNAKGEWRITPAGIVERQRKERLDGMDRRDREAELSKAKPKTPEGDASHGGTDVQEEDDQAEADDGGPSARGPQSVDRPGKDRWKQVLAERAAF